MPKLRPAATVKVSADVSARPLPRSLIEVYYWTENQFRKRSKEIEDDPRFQKLMKKGVLEKIRMRGKIPRHKYEDFKDRELTEFFRKYDIARNPGWEDDFFGPGAIGRRHKLAKQYGCPVGELTRVLRYCEYVWDVTDGGPARAVEMDDESPDFLRFTPSQELFDLGPVVQKLEAFSRRYDLDRETFARLFFALRTSAEDIADEVGCSLREAELALEMVERVQTIQGLQMDVGPSRIADAKATPDRKSQKQVPVAEIFHDHDGAPQLRVLSDDVYDVRYRFNERDGLDLSRDEHELIQELKAVNQRKTVLVRLLGYLFKAQYRFLTTGDLEDVVPLTQAQASRDLHEEEATVSRLIRDKVVRSPWGTYPLKFFFVRTGRVVEILLSHREARLLEDGTRKKPFTDKEIQEILRKEYGVSLSRRSITYHRNKSKKASNFYARSRKAQEAEGKS